MDADFSIELGREDPVLDFPWKDESGKVAYRDLKRRPEQLALVEEAERFPELGNFLLLVNSTRSVLETAKCDVWETAELSAEETIYDLPHKFASYVDAVFCGREDRLSFSLHEQFVRKVIEWLRQAPEMKSRAEVCVRRCYFEEAGEVREGCYFTVYVSGYGEDSARAHENWGLGLKTMGNAIAELSDSRLGWQ